MADDGRTGLFDRMAPTYDRVGVELFGPVAELLLDALVVQRGEHVLDIGCGRGAVLLRAARLAGRADGIDVSPAMVEAAREEAALAGLTVTAEVEDAQAPSRPLASYDVVASSLVLFFLPDPGAALRAWRRLLVHGGRLGVTTFAEVDAPWRAVDAALMAHAPAGMRDPRLVGTASPFASDGGVEQLLRDAGLHEVRTRSARLPVRFDDADHWYRWSWSVGQRGVWEGLPEQDRPRVRAEVEALLAGCRQPDGRIGFEQTVRCTLGRR